MDAVLLIVAWAAGITSLFLVGDMIAADLANRRAERLDARRRSRNSETRAQR